MFLKAVLLIVVAAVAVQSHVPYDAKEQLVLLNDQRDRMFDLIEETVKTAMEALDILNKATIDETKILIETVKSQFTERVQVLLEKIKKLQEEDKVDITECVKDYEAEMNDISNEFTKKITECSEAIISKGKAIIDKEKRTLEQYLEIVEKLEKDFKACGSGPQSMNCKAKVTFNISKVNREILLSINKIVALGKLVPNLQQCVVDNTKDLITREEKIEEEVETCIKNKIHPH